MLPRLTVLRSVVASSCENVRLLGERPPTGLTLVNFYGITPKLE
jgi:hypothetical protein